MSFLFGKSKKNQATPLPAGTRDIASSHGPESRIPTANGLAGPRDGLERRATLGNQSPETSVNNSLNSLKSLNTLDPPRISGQRERADSDANRAVAVRPATAAPPGDSPYPWSQRPLNFATHITPFPRYGAAVNATASKHGLIYMMGGLVNSQMVKGDLWMVDLTNPNLACFPVNTVSDGPGPRVGHASLLVGNAFIVFGGDTKLEDGDVLDDTLYLLNTATKQWSRALPAGPRPAGRYGHTLNIVGSKIYIFGGQVEGFFFNDLIAFDLNTLQVAGNRWEITMPNGGNGISPMPPPRTNHTVVTWQERLYLFGGTDGARWFNDVWSFDPSTSMWSELDCIGYIPAAREGHSAAIINDTMYIFGGRVQDGTDLGDLAAFKISTRRWYMFQNMGSSPSPRSGHSMTAYGNHIVVLAGEPSSAPRDPNELSWAYILDTSKIRYPPSEPANQQPQPPLSLQPSQPLQPVQPVQPIQPVQGVQAVQPQSGPLRNFSSDRGIMPPKTSGIPVMSAQPPVSRPESAQANGVGMNGRQPRSMGTSTPTQQQQSAQSKIKEAAALRAKTPSRGAATPVDARNGQFDRGAISPVSRDVNQAAPQAMNGAYQPSQTGPASGVTSIANSVNPSRSGSQVNRQHSIDSDGRDTPRASVDTPATNPREVNGQVDSGVGSSPALSQGHNEALMKELDAAKNRNAWYASELALARKSGYQPSSSGNPILDQQAAEIFGDDDRPLIEALLRMKAELTRVQGSIDSQSDATASRIAEVEKQRDVAISEAAYAKAKLAAHGGSGSQFGSPQPDALRGTTSPDIDRVNDMSRRLAAALTAQKELTAKIEHLTAELESERRARSFAEDNAEAAEKRIAELDTYKQRSASELESLRAELHDAQRSVREESVNAAKAISAHKLLEMDKNELSAKHANLIGDTRGHNNILESLRDAVAASQEKSDHLEQMLQEERELRATSEHKWQQMNSEHQNRAVHVENLTRQLRDVEDLAARHAQEARTHREAVLSGLGAATTRAVDDGSVTNERVAILSQQLESAHVMVNSSKEAADTAAERLRRAEERIAGLEAYQEQTSRENLTIRKQVQAAMKEVQMLQAEKAESQQRLERSLLDSNALEVQLRTLKHLLDERGISAADVRRSRVLDSPGSRYGTPDLNRIRELERQLDESLKAHDEMRHTLETREQDTTREMEEKLQALSNDHQGTIKYVRGLEKILTKMKAELQRTKSVNGELEKEIAQNKSGSSRGLDEGVPPEWEAERESLRREISEVQKSVKTSVSALESQISTLKSSLSNSEAERDRLGKTVSQAQAQHEERVRQVTQQAHSDLDALRRDNKQLEGRARDAEHKVQMFLDQFENSVDNYRRMSRLEQQTRSTGPTAMRGGGDADSIYSTATMEEDENHEETDTETEGRITPTVEGSAPVSKRGDRSSTALDTLTTELDALRSKWETTSRNYKISEQFEFERGPPASMAGRESLATWARGLDGDDESIQSEESMERMLVSSPRSNHSAAPNHTATTVTSAPRTGPATTKA